MLAAVVVPQVVDQTTSGGKAGHQGVCLVPERAAICFSKPQGRETRNGLAGMTDRHHGQIPRCVT